MQFHVGTSGYSYPKWKGRFYPQKLPQAEMLRYYAEKFSTVELNNTCYRMPTEDAVRSWAGEVSDSFCFALKAPQAITHIKRLKNVEETTDQFLHTASLFDDRLGPLLFQLPPNFKKDLARLEPFLQHLGNRTQAAFEFRHESWFDDEVFACLRAHSCALCAAEEDEAPSRDLVKTADWAYVRLRRTHYTDEELADWLTRIRVHKWSAVHVYFKHEDIGTGPRLATRLLDLIGR